jgi:xylulokinase
MDAEGKIIYNAIPWSDQRAQEEVDFLIKNCKEMMIESSSNYPTTLNAIPHLLWIKNHEPEIYNKLYKYTEPSGFIIQRLTGSFILDYAAASFVEFGIDIEKLEYNKNLIDAMGLDLEKFPKLIANTEMAGTVNKEAASETGLPEGIPVYCGGNDVPAGAIGGGAIRPGQAFLYTGSGSNTTVVTDKLSISSPHLLSCLCINSPKIKILDGVQGSIGFSMKWFCDQLAGIENTASGIINDSINPYELMTAEAQKTGAGSGGLIFLPFLYGHFHPELNPYAKGVFFGISPTTTRPQLIRSIMEGCVFDNYQSFKVIMDLNIDIDEIIFVGGPSNSDLWCQILSDVTNRKVITKHIPEASTLGDAITAGVGVGIFSNFEDVVDNVIKVKNVYAPDEKNHRLYEELYDLYIQIYSDSLESFENLANIREKYNILK